MKKTLIALMAASLSLYPFSSKVEAQTISTDDITSFETSLERNLESAGVLNADVSFKLPMESQSDNLEREIQELGIEELASETSEENIITAAEIAEDEEMVNNIKRELKVENKEIVDTNDIIVEVAATNDIGEEFTTTVGFSIGESVVDVITSTENDNESEYELELLNISSEQINAVLTDVDTNESVQLNSTEAQTSAFWIPALGVFATVSMLELLAISVGASTLIYLASQGLVNLVSGALWVAGKVANDNTKNKKYVHYEAQTSNDSKGIWVGPGRVKSKAIQRIKNGLNCWSIDQTNARLLASGASPTGRYIFHTAHKPKNPDGKRGFHHYHPYETNGAHSFYGGGITW